MSFVYKPFTLKLVMTFKDLTTYTIDDVNSKIIDFKLEEETANEITTPIGVVSSNTIDVWLLNNDDLFTISNTDSPLYGKMGRDVKIELSYSTDNVLYNPIGTFFTTKWNNSSDVELRIRTKIHAVDRLQSLLNLPAPPIQVTNNITLREYTILFLEAIGLSSSDYIVDNTLTQIVDLSVLDGVLAGDIFNSIATAGFAFIYSNRDGKVLVSDRRKENIVSYGVTDNNVSGIGFGPSYANSYSVIRVNYGRVALTDVELMLKLPKINVPTGLKSFKNLKLDKRNLVDLDQVAWTLTGDVVILNVSATQDTVSFDTFNNGVGAVDIGLKVYGRSVDIADTFEEKVYQTAVDSIGERVLNVDNKLLQNEFYAEELADRIFDNLIKEVPYVDFKLRNTSLDLKLEDVITVQHEKLKKNYIGKVQSLSVRYLASGFSLSATITILREDI